MEELVQTSSMMEDYIKTETLQENVGLLPDLGTPLLNEVIVEPR